MLKETVQCQKQHLQHSLRSYYNTSKKKEYENLQSMVWYVNMYHCALVFRLERSDQRAVGVALAILLLKLVTVTISNDLLRWLP